MDKQHYQHDRSLNRKNYYRNTNGATNPSYNVWDYYVENRIFVGGINPEVTEELFKETFEAFGKVQNAKIMYFNSGLSKRFGFISFEDKETVDIVLKEPAVFLYGQKVTVAHAITRKGQPAPTASQTSGWRNGITEGNIIPNRVFVSHVPMNIEEEELRSIFSAYGQVRHVKIITTQNGQYKRYGFVTFERAEEASHLLGEMFIKGERTVIAYAIKKTLSKRATEVPDGVIPNKIFVAGIHPGATEGELQHLFESSGHMVKSVKIIYDCFHVSKKYGFITFGRVESARKVLEEDIYFHGRKLIVAPAKPLQSRVRRVYSRDTRQSVPPCFTEPVCSLPPHATNYHQNSEYYCVSDEGGVCCAYASVQDYSVMYSPAVYITAPPYAQYATNTGYATQVAQYVPAPIPPPYFFTESNY